MYKDPKFSRGNTKVRKLRKQRHRRYATLRMLETTGFPFTCLQVVTSHTNFVLLYYITVKLPDDSSNYRPEHVVKVVIK